MPRYRFGYTLETPLTALRDVTFTSQGFPITLRFSDRIDNLHIRLDAVADGETWRTANEKVMDKIISPVLDALALHKKAPAMLKNLLYIAKGGEGQIRRAIVIEHRSEQNGVDIDPPAIKEVQSFLDSDPKMNKAAIRWLRYCYRPINTLERFVYSWLAFENFLGTRQVQGKCAACKADFPPHPAIDKEAGCKVISSSLPNLPIEDCKRIFRKWWTDLRSPIFHGGRVADTVVRTRMQEAMNLYRPAIESVLQEGAGFKYATTSTTPNDGLLQHQIHHFVEYQTQDLMAEFADPPAVLEVVETQKLPAGVKLLSFQDDTQRW